MTKEQIAEKAIEYKHSGNNCAQSVAKALAESEGIDSSNIAQLTAGFGLGMGAMEGTCGAFVGANIISGLKTEGKGTMAKSKDMFKNFSDKCGASICKELKGIDTGVVLCACDDCVRNAVYAFCESF